MSRGDRREAIYEDDQDAAAVPGDARGGLSKDRLAGARV